MKKLIALIWMLPLVCLAANPSFQSFNLNDFTTNNYFISLNATNLTNNIVFFSPNGNNTNPGTYARPKRQPDDPAVSMDSTPGVTWVWLPGKYNLTNSIVIGTNGTIINYGLITNYNGANDLTLKTATNCTIVPSDNSKWYNYGEWWDYGVSTVSSGTNWNWQQYPIGQVLNTHRASMTNVYIYPGVMHGFSECISFELGECYVNVIGGILSSYHFTFNVIQTVASKTTKVVVNGTQAILLPGDSNGTTDPGLRTCFYCYANGVGSSSYLELNNVIMRSDLTTNATAVTAAFNGNTTTNRCVFRNTVFPDSGVTNKILVTGSSTTLSMFMAANNCNVTFNEMFRPNTAVSPRQFYNFGTNAFSTLVVQSNTVMNGPVLWTNAAAKMTWDGQTLTITNTAAATRPYLSYNTNGTLTLGTNNQDYFIANQLGTVIAQQVSATNGFILQGKMSFTTNFAAVTNIQMYNISGTNQLIWLPDITKTIPFVIYRFTSTNGFGSYTLATTNAAVRIRDGISTNLTAIGIQPTDIYSDGANWWLSSKSKVVMPTASWSLTTNYLIVQNVITNIAFNQLEFNNSQGIALVNGYRFYITNFGQYMFTYSAQTDGGGGGGEISIWMRQGDVDLPRTRTRQINGNNQRTCVTVNYIVNVTTNNTFFSLAASSDEAGVSIPTDAANIPVGFASPVAPGVIVTINKVSDTFP